MNKEIEHTKLPWKIEQEENHSLHIVDTKTGIEVIATVYCDPLDDYAKADARYIVRACNNHPELVEAVEYYLKGIKHFYSCINFAKSNLDAEAIEFMNDSEIKFRKVFKSVNNEK